MIAIMPAWCLSVHRSWQCRHAGACCQAGWSIPVEAEAFETVRLHFQGAAGDGRLVTGGPLPEGAAAVLGTREDRTCCFYDGRLCTIHRDIGPHALPVACQQFPRIVLRDARGTFITLSHFCPTAAGLLLEAGPIAIVEAPAGLALAGAVEGLDATAVLPPLLRPGLLTDLEGYAEWERRSIDVLACDRWTAEGAIYRIAAATDRLAAWNPSHGPLADAVSVAFRPPHSAKTPAGFEHDALRFATAAAAVPPGLRAPVLDPALSTAWPAARARLSLYDRAARAWLAARLFGSWVAYYAQGLATVVESLRVCLAVLRIEIARRVLVSADEPAELQFLQGVRRADLLLVHLGDPRLLTESIQHAHYFSPQPVLALRRHRYPLG